MHLFVPLFRLCLCRLFDLFLLLHPLCRLFLFGLYGRLHRLDLFGQLHQLRLFDRLNQLDRLRLFGRFVLLGQLLLCCRLRPISLFHQSCQLYLYIRFRRFYQFGR